MESMDDERRMRDLIQATSGCMSHMCPILDGHLARELDVVGWGNRVGGFPFGGGTVSLVGWWRFGWGMCGGERISKALRGMVALGVCEEEKMWRMRPCSSL